MHYELGRDTFAVLLPGGGERLDEIFRVAPALAQMAVGTVYGHLHHRAALEPRIREAAALAAIVASGMHGTPLAVHLRTGLAVGLAPAEVVEVLLEAAAFSGFPRAVASLPTVEEVFRQADLPVPPESSPREIVLAVLDELRQAGTRPADSPLAACLAPHTTMSVHTVAADQVIILVAASGSPARPEEVLHVLVKEGRIAEITSLTRPRAHETNPA
jgi:4-carboxymuconolactone decarboxylase